MLLVKGGLMVRLRSGSIASWTLHLSAVFVIVVALVGCSAQFSNAFQGISANTCSAPFPYLSSPLAATLTPPISSANISSNYFGMTIHSLAPNSSTSSTGGLTPFPPFHFSTFRLWDVAAWRILEPSKGVFDWTKMDGTIAIARKNGVRDFVFTFGNIPVWASTNPADPCGNIGWGPGTCDPPDMAAFDDFTARMVQRYCGTVKYYEPWNEPNSKQFWGGTNAQLLEVTKHLYQIAKDPANCGCVDGVCSPNGGTNPNQVMLPPITDPGAASVAWLDSYLAAAGPQYPYADIASFHGYGATNPEDIVAGVQLIKLTLAKYGLADRQLWNTEASWGPETSELGEQQASWLMRYHIALVASGVSRFIWYAYDNCTWGTLWLGSSCRSSQGAPNSITIPGTAYGVIESWLTGASLDHCDHYQNNLWACELHRARGFAGWMLWSASGTSISVPIPDTIGLTVYRDWQNNVNALPAQIIVSQMPVLLETHDI